MLLFNLILMQAQSQKIELSPPRVEKINRRHVSSADDDNDGSVVGDEVDVESIRKINHRQRRSARRLDQHSGMFDKFGN